MTKLNLGCYKTIMKDYINVDKQKLKGVNVICDLDIEPYPFENNSINEIYASSIIEHLENLGIFFKECKRILKINGKLVIKTDNASYFLYHFNKWNHGNWLSKDKSDMHYHLFLRSHLINLANRHKFKIIEEKYETKAYSWKGKLLFNILSIFGNRFSNTMISIILRK